MTIVLHLIDVISDNTDALVQTNKYGAINTADTTTMGYYGIKFISEPYTLQEETMRDGKISTPGELVVKSQYIKFMQYNINCYW